MNKKGGKFANQIGWKKCIQGGKKNLKMLIRQGEKKMGKNLKMIIEQTRLFGTQPEI